MEEQDYKSYSSYSIFGNYNLGVDVEEELNKILRDSIATTGQFKIVTIPPKKEEKRNITLERMIVLWKKILESPTIQVTSNESNSFELKDDKSKHTLVIRETSRKIELEYYNLKEFQIISTQNPYESLMKITRQLFIETGINHLEEDIAGR